MDSKLFHTHGNIVACTFSLAHASKKFHGCDTLEMIWSILREREDFRLFWNNGDDPSRANFLFHGLNQANELRPAQGYCGQEADILGTTASLGLDGVSRLDYLHGARRP